MDEQGKIFWHSAHHEALQLELHAYADILEFKLEHPLSQEALRMDTLIIKKKKDVQITKNIGKIFRSHNVVEYKSEKDHFSYWDYQKVLAYALLYSNYEKVPIQDITISISLTIFPRQLVKKLEKDYGHAMEAIENGIYYIHGAMLPIQILESKNLSEDENTFLHNLRSNLSAEAMTKTIQSYSALEALNNKNVFIDRLVKANENILQEVLAMFSDEVRDIVMKVGEEKGWFNKRDQIRENNKAKKIARQLLLLALTPEKIAEATELPLETVIEIANAQTLHELSESVPVGV